MGEKDISQQPFLGEALDQCLSDMRKFGYTW